MHLRFWGLRLVMMSRLLLAPIQQGRGLSTPAVLPRRVDSVHAAWSVLHLTLGFFDIFEASAVMQSCESCAVLSGKF